MTARASALGEAVERYSGIFRGDEVRVRGSYRKLANKAVHPNTCMNFSAHQYRDREKWNRIEAEHNWVPVPFDENQEIEWTPGWSLTEERTKYVPTATCYFGYPRSANHDFCRPDSNGNAAGVNAEEAILHGFLEVVERDSVALWWYNRVRRPGVDLASFEEPYFQALVELYRILGRKLHVLDIRADFPIPVYAAVSSGKYEGDLLFGFGAHLQPRLAVMRALTEMNQGLAQALTGDLPRYFVGALDEGAFLEPDGVAPVKSLGQQSSPLGEDLQEDLRICMGLAWDRGIETLVVDQTRSDTGMRVVKVILPGMRSWWARFGPGRLYDVPVKIGWQTTPVQEERLNPCHLVV